MSGDVERCRVMSGGGVARLVVAKPDRLVLLVLPVGLHTGSRYRQSQAPLASEASRPQARRVCPAWPPAAIWGTCGGVRGAGAGSMPSGGGMRGGREVRGVRLSEVSLRRLAGSRKSLGSVSEESRKCLGSASAGGFSEVSRKCRSAGSERSRPVEPMAPPSAYPSKMTYLSAGASL